MSFFNYFSPRADSPRAITSSCDDEIPPRLADVCLDTIAENLYLFNFIFITNKNDNMYNRQLEFLQRKYTYDILKRVCYWEDLHLYLDLLLNKYLHILKTPWLKNYPWEKVISKMAEIGSSIEELYLDEDHRQEERPWQKIVCYFPNLKNIKFSNFTKDFYLALLLESIGKYSPNIEEIYFENSSITLEVAKSLCKNEKPLCTKLKKLCVSSANFKVDGMKYFVQNFRTLEIIDFPDLPLVLYTLHKNDFLDHNKIEPYNIRELKFLNYTYTLKILKVCLYVCPLVKSITINLVKEIDFCPNAPELEQLNLINISSSEINVNSFFKLKKENLTSLNIVNCTVSISSLAESCPHIKELTLRKVNLSFNDDLKPVFNSLISCSFENTDFSMNTNAISFLLSSLTTLESLAFRKCRTFSEIETLILKVCKKLHSVKKISFYLTEVQMEYLKQLLLHCSNLSCLSLYNSFDMNAEHELLKFAESLPNKPEISNYPDYGKDYDEYFAYYYFDPVSEYAFEDSNEYGNSLL